MATSIPELDSADAIATRLKLPRHIVIKVLEFLLRNGLVIEQNNRLKMGAQSTHIGNNELLVSRHHTNWRLKAIESIGRPTDETLHFTSPLSIGRGDISVVRKILTESLDRVFEVVDPSPSEELACLNIDWFPIAAKN